MKDELIEQIAKMAHNINVIYCDGLDVPKKPFWDDVDEESRKSSMHGVQHRMDNPMETREDVHNEWMRYKKQRGWVYGENRDDEAKVHPCMCDYDQLPKQDRLKDDLFVAVVYGCVALIASTDGGE